MTRRSWTPIIDRARDIVTSYPFLITLRQLHYRLVAEATGGYRNNQDDYGRLSELTAAARRDGTFPSFADQTRSIHLLDSWSSPNAALDDLASWYRRDRTDGQDWQIVLGGEKATMLAQLGDWYEDRGFPIVLLRGFGSQTYLDTIADHVRADGRPAVLIYAGDFDASGQDILRDFLVRCPVFDKVEHIALLSTQITALSLTVNQGKGEDSRAFAFRAAHPDWAAYADERVTTGIWPVQRDKKRRIVPNVVQVEVEAIDPVDLQTMYETAIGAYWDETVYDAVVDEEEAERDALKDLARDWTRPV